MVYKTNLGRVTTLLEHGEIEKLVSLFSRNDIIEELVSLHSNGRGAMSYRLLPRYSVDELKQMYAAGIEHVAETCEELCKAEADCPRRARPRNASSRRSCCPSFRPRPANAEA